MLINDKLLIKYHQRLCSPEEKAAVEQWLQREDGVYSSDGILLENETALKAEIWSAIKLKYQTAKRKAKNLRRVIAYATAACVAGLLMLVKWQPSLLSKTTEIRNDGLIEKTMVVNQLQLTIPAGSRCWINTPILRSSTATIRFCGAIAVLNKCKTFTLNVITDNIKCVGNGKDVVQLHQGQRYMAITDKDYNLIAATEEELKDGIPKLFSYRLIERFKL